MNEVSNEKLLHELKWMIQQIEAEKFQGVLFYSNKNERVGFIKAVGGTAEDRLNMIDYAWMTMAQEPISESRDWFFTQVYDRFKQLRPTSLVEADRSIS